METSLNFTIKPLFPSIHPNLSLDYQEDDPSSNPIVDGNTTITDFELLEPFWQTFLISLYSLTAALSFIGNIVAIWVLMAGKRSSRELRMFLVNLSLSDVTMALFSIPFTYTDFILGRWIFHPAFCPVVQFMQLTSVFVSVYTLTIIGIDRYIAIMYPFGTTRWSKWLGPYIVCAIWLLGTALGSIIWYNSTAEPFQLGNETYYDCRETWGENAGRTYTLTIFSITFALPMTILTYVYGSVAYKMFKHSVPGNADAVRDEAQHLAKVKVIKMLSTIVILFALCWLPIHILNLLIAFKRDWMETLFRTEYGNQTYVALIISAHWLSMSNSFVNPVIYCFMSDNFRTDLKFLATTRCPVGRNVDQKSIDRTLDNKRRSIRKITFRSSLAPNSGNTETTSINQSSPLELSPKCTIRSIIGPTANRLHSPTGKIPFNGDKTTALIQMNTFNNKQENGQTFAIHLQPYDCSSKA